MNNENITVRGIILSSTNTGENDRRVVLLTRERGRITAFANGARRPTSHLLAMTNPFSYGAFELYEGRNSYTVRKAEIQEHFEGISADLDRILYGTFFLEVCDYYARENLDESQRLLLLYATEKALAGGKVPLPLIKEIFLERTMVVNGDFPDVFSCAVCGKREDIVSFSPAKRGVLCRADGSGGTDEIILSESALYALRYVVTCDVGKLYSFLLSDEAFGQYRAAVEGYRKRYFHHSFRSEGFMEGPSAGTVPGQ